MDRNRLSRIVLLASVCAASAVVSGQVRWNMRPTLPLNSPGWNYGRVNCNPHTTPPGAVSFMACVQCCQNSAGELNWRGVRDCQTWCAIAFGPNNF